MLGKAKVKKGKGGKKGKSKGKGKKGECNKDEKGKDEDKKDKGKGKSNAKATKHFAGYLLVGMRAETPIIPAVNTATEPPITRMLTLSDEGEVVPCDPAPVAVLGNETRTQS